MARSLDSGCGWPISYCPVQAVYQRPSRAILERSGKASGQLLKLLMKLLILLKLLIRLLFKLLTKLLLKLLRKLLLKLRIRSLDKVHKEDAALR